jgi:tRNA threonylcarbamoyladenosine biosynthesis protein TsaE
LHHGIVGTPSELAQCQWLWVDEAETARFAAQLAVLPKLSSAFIELRGDLGAGKTSFVRHLLRALGVQGRIKSPTYAVVEPHEITGEQGTSRVWHFDFYRFTDPLEWEDAGFRDIFAADGLKLAEWPDKAKGVLPTPDLVLCIEVLPAPGGPDRADSMDEPGPAPRQARMSAHTELGLSLLRGLGA